tara:strand:+ start:32834 stop:33850 length:1017 start_codon:yes stop_codon:yes gene_type:complete
MINNQEENISVFKKAVDDDFLHVFLVNNPITVLVVRLIIDYFKIDQSNIMIVSIRNTNTEILSSNPIYNRINFIDKVFIKVLNLKPLSNRILAEIEKKGKHFLLYSSWAYDEKQTNTSGISAISSHPSIENLINSKLCMGHSYIEEGQASYRSSKPYLPSKKNFYHQKYLEKIKNFANDEDRQEARLYYRNDALAFFGLLEDVFPKVEIEKKIIFSNYEDLKKYYRPQLKGIESIGITCAIRRITEDKWEHMLSVLIENINGRGAIKLHPSFVNEEAKRNKLEALFKKLAPSSIHLCNDDVNIELEMLYEPKKLVGSRTSLKKYAEAFGSKFLEVDLY